MGGIEPTPTVLETVVLPLNYIRIMGGEGFEPPNPKERIYSPPRLASSLPSRRDTHLDGGYFNLPHFLTDNFKIGLCMVTDNIGGDVFAANIKFVSIHALTYEYDSTFLHCCGLISSHAVPISHSVLSGLDNEPLFKRERFNMT